MLHGRGHGVGGSDPVRAHVPWPRLRSNTVVFSRVAPAHEAIEFRANTRTKGTYIVSYIPKQLKQTRERVEAKLDQELIEELEQYCRYLESDRDYVIAQALKIAFRKDKAFAAWRTRAGLTQAGPAQSGAQLAPTQSGPVGKGAK